ncbi:MAG: aminotransferase class III-fold pyridoxal phosphate-dependent enzyme, partial [Gemmatimonadetes bacterium]|nr:aminotransferase class III-fold pyridoxal phosphate-dependent enzyme [Gemmatimonadota bacterium]
MSSAYPPIPAALEGSALVAEYAARTAGSARLATRARSMFPSGITHDARYIEPHGIYVTHAEGSHKWDVDGNEYVDYPGGHGALIHGHSHPDIVQAVQEQIGKGVHYGASSELELEWADCIQKLVPGAERIRFTNSGTESTQLALRLARAATGRSKVVRLMGHFHGWHDHAASGFL